MYPDVKKNPRLLTYLSCQMIKEALTPAFPCCYGAQRNSRQEQGFVGCSFLSDDQQSHVGNDIEDQKDDFE
jgi:hypothetical protein